MDSKPLIAISFIDRNVKSHCSNTDLVGIPQQDIRIFIRPSAFEELTQLITKEYNPKDKSPNSKLVYYGILPSGYRVEISDDLTFQKEISIIFACYNKNSMNSEISKIINPNSYFSKDNIKDQIREDDIPTLKINDEIIHRMKTTKIPDDILKHKKSIEDYVNKPKDSLENIKKNITELYLSSSKENIRKSLSNLDEIKDKIKDFGSKSSKYLNMLKNSKKQLGEMKKTLQNIKIRGGRDNVLSKKKIEAPPKPEPKPEEEKIIFKFKEENIKVEKDISDIKGKEINIEKILVKNISKKEYNSSSISWLKEANSDENINFKPGKVNREDKIYFSNQDISDLLINLTIDNPKENSEYKILVSLINNKSKKIISEKPLKILVKIKEKALTKEEIENILKEIKKDFDLLDLILKYDEIKQIIAQQKGDINNIKNLIKEKYTNEKSKKINELLDKLEKDTNFSKKLQKNEVEMKIIENKFDEKAIKEWINSRIASNPIIDEEKIKELFERIDGELYISSVIEDKDFREAAIRFHYDYDKLKEWCTSQM